MTLTTISKKSVAAACLVAPLTLAACGSGDETNVVSETATATNTITSAAQAGEESTAENTDAEKATEDPNNPEADAAAAGAAGGIVNPFEDGTIPTVEVKPIEGGKEASKADIDAMTETMNRIYNPKDLVSWSRTIMDNSCQKVVDQTTQELASRGTSLEQTEREMQQAVDAAKAAGRPVPPIPATSPTLSDVKIDGDVASATVTVTTNGQTDSGVQRFAREGGQWKVCN